ncbi:MAG: anti-sigma F factor [Clostridiaceae bacterium]|jgi:stage II sporulation protein AB (anti-sigma F factor)|nr:anti-sigma F factor [Clostridiaceae bacterium]
MQSINRMKIEFDSKSTNEAFARVVVAAFAAQLDPTLEELADLKTAVSEAVTNAIIHGYENKPGTIYMECVLYTGEIMVVIEDKGVGIEDIEKARIPSYTTKPELERSGLGFSIMESFTDSFEIESSMGSGTKITMKKKFTT